MEYDMVKVEEALLALLGVFEFENGRVWKKYDFSVMDALHDKGFITQPHSAKESVVLTDEGLRLAKELAAKYFQVNAAGPEHS
ncbi:DUF6429 family protein [Variovorax sp. H27-G14]|uniref:DUF6429 family protein n=1 Tax=Variovorax sp. H27-G14 TaxID=3111914 RepID=UPI0038FD3EC7